MRTNKVLKTIAFSLLTIIVVIISELIYVTNNIPQYSGLPLFLIARYESSRNIKNSFNFFLNGVDKINAASFKQYPNLTHATIKNFIVYNASDNELKDYAELIKDPKLFAVPNSKAALAKELYKFALVSYKNGDGGITKELFMASTLLDPEFSYYPVELANLYLSDNETGKAKNVMEFCKSFEVPKKHCEEFEKNSLETKEPLPVGNFAQDVLKYK